MKSEQNGDFDVFLFIGYSEMTTTNLELVGTQELECNAGGELSEMQRLNFWRPFIKHIAKGTMLPRV